MRALLIAAATLAALPVALPAAAQTRVDPARLSADVRTLASTDFGGRAPGTPGEKKTLDWLVAQFKAIGLEPGGPDGKWLQPVPLIHTRIAPDAWMTIGDTPLKQGRDIAVTTVRPEDAIAITASPMVFVGYGVSAPEVGWDDFKGVDVKGKTVVFLINCLLYTSPSPRDS